MIEDPNNDKINIFIQEIESGVLKIELIEWYIRDLFLLDEIMRDSSLETEIIKELKIKLFINLSKYSNFVISELLKPKNLKRVVNMLAKLQSESSIRLLFDLIIQTTSSQLKIKKSTLKILSYLTEYLISFNFNVKH